MVVGGRLSGGMMEWLSGWAAQSVSLNEEAGNSMVEQHI